MNTIHSIRGRLAVVAIAAMMVGSMLGSATLDSAEAQKKKNGHNPHDFLVAVLALVDAEVCTAEAEDGTTATQFVCSLVSVNVQDVRLLNNFLNRNDVELEVLNVDIEDSIIIEDIEVEIGDILSDIEVELDDVNICGVVVAVGSIVLVDCKT